MKPILAHTYTPRLITFPCYVQPKFNGIRALYQNGCFQSRDELPWNPTVLAHLAQPLLELFGPATVLDGELYCHGWPLPRINGAIAINRLEPNADTIKVGYYVYDQVDYATSFVDRFAQVSEKIQAAKSEIIFAATTMEAKNVVEVETFYALCVAQGFEGIMYRLGDCPYTQPKQAPSKLLGNRNSRAAFLSDKNNRTWHLIKRKDWQDAEFLIVGLVEGEGKRANMTGSIELQTASGKTFFCGTGFSESDAVRWWENRALVVGHWAKIQYLVLSPYGIPLNNSLIQIL